MAVGMAFMGAVVASETTSSFSTASYNGNSNNRMSSTIIASGSSSNSRSASSRSSSQSPVDRFDIDYDVETNNNNNTDREFMQARERLMMGTTTTTASISNNNNNNTIIGGRFRNSKSTHSQSTTLSKEQQDFKIGLLCATYVGIANGSFMTPLKYANKEVTGIEYLFSFGLGSAIMTILLVFFYNLYRRHVKRDYSRLNFHFDTCAKPALLTGLLWSAGNACSIIAISRLGVSIGWPLVQCQLIVSTTWGIFYYREVKGNRAICGFFCSCFLVLFGVVMLGHSSR